MFDYNKFEKIYPGYWYVIAQDTDGYIYGSGLNDCGQLGTGFDRCHQEYFTQLDYLFDYISDIKQVVCGSYHTLMLKNDGTVWGCGRNTGSELGLLPSTNHHKLTQINISDVKSIASYDSSFAIKNDGTLWACGTNNNGQLGLGDTTHRKTFTQVNITNVKDVFCGPSYTFILKNDGTVWATGYNYYGQLGLGDKTNKNAFTQINITDVKDISCGYNSTFILKNDGTAWATGYNYYGQLGLGDTTDRTTFTQVATNVKDISCGEYYSFITKNDGTVWACGVNGNGQLGLGDNTNRATLTQMSNINNVKKIFAGKNGASFLIKNDNSLWACGNNSSCKLGVNNNESSINNFTKVLDNVKNISNGRFHSIALTNDNSLYIAGLGEYGALGKLVSIKAKYKDFTKLMNEPVKKVWNNPDQYCTYVLKNDNSLWVCGGNWNGQLGVGDNNYDEVEYFTKVLDNVKDVIFSCYCTFFLKNDDSLWFAGATWYGEGTIGVLDDPQWVPVDTGISNVKNVYAGDCFTFILKNDNTLWSCGSNKFGALGLGHNNNMTEVSHVTDNVVDVILGHPMHYADSPFIIKNDGTVWACGQNTLGQLGLGDKTNKTSFVQVSNMTNIKKIDLAFGSSFILKDNILYCSGDNSTNSFGANNNGASTFTPVFYDVNDFYLCDYENIFVIKNDGTVWVCGYNGYGRLGIGEGLINSTVSWTQVPFPESGLNIKDVAIFDEHGFIIMNNGSAYYCGSNNLYQNGCNLFIAEKNMAYNDFTKFKLPYKINNYETVINNEIVSIDQVSCGDKHEAIIDENGRIFVRGDNDYGQLGLGDNIDKENYTELNETNIKNIRATKNITVIEKDGQYYVIGEHVGSKFTKYNL